MSKAILAIVPAAAVVTTALATTVQFALAETRTVDDLAGLRPDTQGVETNAFWDTRAHLTYTVQSILGASTNSFDTSVLTVAASNVNDVGGQKGFVLIVR